MEVGTYKTFYTDIKPSKSLKINNNVVVSGDDYIIDVIQTEAEKKNEFEVCVNGKKEMTATLPFLTISVNNIFDLNKISEMKVNDLEGNLKYVSSYNLIENRIEEFIPLKYLVTGSQKFDQITFTNQKDESQIEIYQEAKTLLLEQVVIKANDKYYKCYKVEDGTINHFSIYDEDKQIAELLKPNVVIEGKDQYRIYLKHDYSFLCDALSIFALYLDRVKYNSSYLYNRSEKVSSKKTYSGANKYYDPNWVKDNFDVGSYFEDIDNFYKKTKNKVLKILTIVLIIVAIIAIITIALMLLFLPHLQ